MTKGLWRPIWTAVAAGWLSVAGSAAMADCYDILGCSNKNLFSRHFDYLGSVKDGPNCEFLKGIREGIMAEGGPNLSKIETANMATIRRAEGVKHCPP